MITDKQIEIVGKHLGNYLIPDGMNDKLIKNMLKELIDNYEQSKWIEFDVYDVNTMPKHGNDIICLMPNGNSHYSIDVCTFDYATKKFYIACDDSRIVSHWQLLPETPAEK